MKGNLPVREKEFLEKWENMGLYEKWVAKNKGRKKFILHDGPPYSNGDIHIGTALNRTLKDVVIRFKALTGFETPFVPGWDFHGLPVELQALKSASVDRKSADPLAVRKMCEKTAFHFMNIQREQFKRLGCLADWQKPYLTHQPEYEAVELNVFWKLYQEGCIYRGTKPVFWCIDCETALAEAEVEYEEKTNPSIYVKFLLTEYDAKKINHPDDPISVLIWTTTPWTLPGNVAIALHPEFEYVFVKPSGKKEVYVLAKDRLQDVSEHLQFGNFKTVFTCTGKDMEGWICLHPFLERKVPLILASYVTKETGTGCVHTAPGHGLEDYESGQKYGLPVLSPVDEKGCFTREAGAFPGVNVFEANSKIVSLLKDKKALLREETLSHSYPHCWRCKEPVIFRATMQWFIALQKFASLAKDEIEKVKWVPAHGKDRILGMVSDRPDWCISRQRYWGVPIPAFYCASCKTLLLTEETMARVSEKVSKEGCNAWFSYSAKELLPENASCPSCKGKEFEKERDILDVWFDSGSSHLSVLEKKPELAWPADLYLEGSDQHRGWFQSSLWVGLATRGRAPYCSVLTHGFTVDEEGKKMSKSLGNVIDPQKIVSEFGADVLRLWVMSSDIRADVKVSRTLLLQVVEAYRKIRNTLRFLLGNLYDFDPEKHSVADEKLLELDRFMLIKLDHLLQKVTHAYESYDFHLVYHYLYNFATIDLSSFYLDVLKETLYTYPPDSLERRSHQTTLYRILKTLTLIQSPVLPFTSEEVWQCLPGVTGKEECVHLCDWPAARIDAESSAVMERWNKFFSIRDEVNRQLEVARQKKEMGSSLDAHVKISAPEETIHFLKTFSGLKGLFLVSKVTLNTTDNNNNEVQVQVTSAEGNKCARCWNYDTTVGMSASHPQLCERCAGFAGHL